MLSMPEPNRILIKLAPNNAAAVLNRIADTVAVDLNRPRVGMRHLLALDAADIKITHMPQGVMMIDGHLPGLDAPYMLLAQLTRPVLFQSGDRRGADLIAVLFSPDQASIGHLQTTARLARLLGDTAVIAAWREETTVDGIRALFNIPHLDGVSRSAVQVAA